MDAELMRLQAELGCKECPYTDKHAMETGAPCCTKLHGCNPDFDGDGRCLTLKEALRPGGER